MAMGIPSPSHSEAFFLFRCGYVPRLNKCGMDDNNRVFGAMHGITMFAFFKRDERSWGAIACFPLRLLYLVLYMKNYLQYVHEILSLSMSKETRSHLQL